MRHRNLIVLPESLCRHLNIVYILLIQLQFRRNLLNGITFLSSCENFMDILDCLLEQVLVSSVSEGTECSISAIMFEWLVIYHLVCRQHLCLSLVAGKQKDLSLAGRRQPFKRGPQPLVIIKHKAVVKDQRHLLFAVLD